MNVDSISDMNTSINDSQNKKYEELLERQIFTNNFIHFLKIISLSSIFFFNSFEELELHIPEEGADYGHFLNLNEICIGKVEKLIGNEEDTKSTYFVSKLK